MHTMEKYNVVRLKWRVLAGFGTADCGALSSLIVSRRIPPVALPEEYNNEPGR